MSEKSNQIFQQLAAEQPDSLYAELARERTAKAEPAD
jgi:hypothetical protein